MSTQPINGSSSTATTLPETTASPATPIAADPEGLIAQIAMRLEDSAQRSRDSQRRSRSLRTEARRSAIKKKRGAAALRLAGTVVNSAAQIASAAVQIGAAGASTQNKAEVAEYERTHPQQTGPQRETSTPGVEDGAGLDAPPPADDAPLERSEEIMKRGEARGQLLEALGSASQGAAEFGASRLDSRAEQHSLAAEEHAEHGDMLRDAADSAERFADKALGHQEAIARARHEATMAAIRG